MAVSCPVRVDTDLLRREVEATYTRVATEPNGEYHFHRGPEYAVGILGYDAAELALLPRSTTESFAGVGNPLSIGELGNGETVLDIGSGAGTDLLLAAQRVGPGGKAIGVDMTEAMRKRAADGARALSLDNVEIRAGVAEALPAQDASVDVVISNGVLNLAPDKVRAFAEIARVLRPGGRLYLADIVAEAELSDDIRSDIDLWTG